MADISLDDFIRKKNVQVRISNTQKRQQNANQKTKPIRQQGLTRPSLQTKGFNAQAKPLQKAVIDARDKIVINKKSGRGDARNKIVQIQVKKGTFDARSRIKRQGAKEKNDPPNGSQGNNTSGPMQLTRTLSNPNAQNKGHIKVTNNGLQVTRKVPPTPVSMSIQNNKAKKGRGPAPLINEAMPIIQIRNDRYERPQATPPSLTRHSHPSTFSSSMPPSAYRNNPNNGLSSRFPSHHAYRDLDNPQFNAASIAVPEVPKYSYSSIKTVVDAGMQPISHQTLQHPITKAPPGSATLSLMAKRPTVSKAQPLPAKLPVAGMKRRQVPPPAEVGGPLKLGKGGGPGVQIGIGDLSQVKRSKLSMPEDIEIIDLEDSSEFVSPLQGFRLMVTNLFTGVTQEDIIELFGVVGPLKKAKLLKAGTAEVVYSSKEDAMRAVQKYHSRELDGQPMFVKMTTPEGAVVKMSAQENDPDITGEALRLYKKPGAMGSLPKAPVEVPTIHRALFKVGPAAPNKSVKFTVKI